MITACLVCDTLESSSVSVSLLLSGTVSGAFVVSYAVVSGYASVPVSCFLEIFTVQLEIPKRSYAESSSLLSSG